MQFVTSPPARMKPGRKSKCHQTKRGNRYSRELGRNQRILLDLVANPGVWALVREMEEHRTALGGAFQAYDQITVSTRKRADGFFDIYAIFEPGETGKPEEKLEVEVARLNKRQAKGSFAS